MKLTNEAVTTIFLDCLFSQEELASIGAGMSIPDNAVLVEGITMKVGFHPQRLRSHEGEIIALLNQLPDSFLKSKGGGMTFLHLCEDRDGEQWTGMHKVMQELVLLGIAIDRVSFPLGRDLWSALPGGMPYVVVEA